MSQNVKPTHFRSEGDVNTTPARQVWNESMDDERTQTLLKRDSDVFLHQAMSTPCLDTLEAAEGIYIQDANGKKYMDFHGNNVHQLGYGHPHVIERVQEQIAKLPFSPRRFTNETAIKCAEKLTQICGGELNRVLFAPGGTSTIGMALKLARHITGNYKVVSLWDSFHGASLDAISVGGEACFRHGMGPLMAGVERIPPAVSYRGALPSPDGHDVHYADYLEYVIEKEGGVGAFIAEAVRNTDVQVPSKAYWKRIREICDKHNVMLIIDDIPNGMGRSGEWFTYQAYDIEPDILCIGKGLGGGLVPIAAMVTKDKYNTAEQISMGHYTHEKSPIGCAAALATMEVIEQENLLDKAKADGQFMREKLLEMKAKYPVIGDVRGIGMLWGVELVTDHETKQRAFDEAEAVLYQCLNDGMSFKVSQGNVIQLSPPLVITREQLTQAMAIFEEAIAKVSKDFNYL
ncbi:aspartate aminotransferase family protein [Vibrio natriegens]|uniref:4-aminobutyrate aminotransferase n=1 Tax=Vibrio natriegens NBRC 15636 = ATCC 14048 = DSM 759 TaxID=1219067 RepID=A0AAN0Y707_VIBNA|nr:aspartate aminotransferase family protein [Vibrio natriegens]ALR17686.1 4-aminobutyrate aminotransferase [Vibrio natriegens NBRC 15636 = ATCC 14048 = DSM 759]ANQ15177.1 4-aminobutyrate aminotransferase [Vibrio natriegens NBRC 15636 = ATCC 14048 = DSM 759]MDX6029477.1 aspartate aminotransferase family protein [Vibrio natriegens NBRC 15636 = ATCC 14048 = DSM 759]UUI13824.1 aspartate aminotransferase family protein [Vibrio natriegens]WRS51369.1 aspartate aminotransferase family protein [Vibrio